MLKYMVTAAGILLAIWGSILLYNFYFTNDYMLEIRLAEMTLEDIQDKHEVFDNKVLTFTLDEPGKYRMEVEGVEDAHSAGRIGYNAMVTLIMANWELQTPRHTYKIEGYQDGELIFEVLATAGRQPEVTLYGPFEGIEYVPSFSKSPNPAPSNETYNLSITSHA